MLVAPVVVVVAPVVVAPVVLVEPVVVVVAPVVVAPVVTLPMPPPMRPRTQFGGNFTSRPVLRLTKTDRQRTSGTCLDTCAFDFADDADDASAPTALIAPSVPVSVTARTDAPMTCGMRLRMFCMMPPLQGPWVHLSVKARP
ncbi:hypothetical protein San01_01210 [Streptomyces angustmyceticus]|uniref:Uncharacterized protein n=1 Tax=Streptomyces angustmyceticus TaxID=285578 RepID=A0A5J4LBY8_9ACTN|nr:hypothetical protein San01_01210 [Streptomyces angustmyceticus]